MPGIENFLDEYIPQTGEVAVDVGANRGVWSRFLATRFPTVYAIEANPALHSELGTLHPHVQVLPYGAWSCAQRLTFTLFGHDANTSAADDWQGIKAGPPLGSFEALCLAIDDMPIEGRVDFIKIDVEAAEVEAVRGAQDIILRDRPRLIIEVHTAQAGDELARLFASWRYRLTMIRHPYYDENSPWWDEHYWLVCEPGRD